MTRLAFAFLVVLQWGSAIAAAPDGLYVQPELDRLMDAVTLHVSFDSRSMMPDMAEGPAYAPQVFAPHADPAGKPQFADGLVGKALVLGTGGAVYPRAGNVLLEKRGALALWVRAENWQRPRDGNCVFAMTTRAAFYLERQGPDVDADGRVRRHEGILYIARGGGSRTMTLNGGSDWQNGRWHLLVANWSWPTMELSTNGEPFQVRALSEAPDADSFGDLVLGDRGGDPRGLLDEVLAFRRPLTLEEVRLLWEFGSRETGEQASRGTGERGRTNGGDPALANPPSPLVRRSIPARPTHLAFSPGEGYNRGRFSPVRESYHDVRPASPKPLDRWSGFCLSRGDCAGALVLSP